MTNPEEHTPMTFDEVSRIAQEMTLQQGNHVPLLMVQGDQQALLFPMTEMADTHEGRAQQMFITGLMLASSGEVGVLQQVFFVTEGWLSVVENGKIPDTPPSQDPQRKEVLTISNLDMATGQTQMTLFEMKRDEQGSLQSLETPEWRTGIKNSQAESPLLNAFVLGFFGTALEVDD
jgi:hypothetical protein